MKLFQKSPTKLTAKAKNAFGRFLVANLKPHAGRGGHSIKNLAKLYEDDALDAMHNGDGEYGRIELSRFETRSGNPETFDFCVEDFVCELVELEG